MQLVTLTYGIRFLGCRFLMMIRGTAVFVFLCLALGELVTLSAQTDVELKRGRTQYMKWCSNCHGDNHEGGLGGSLKTSEFKQVGKTIGFLDYVKRGNTRMGMPSFGGALSDKQILSVAH